MATQLEKWERVHAQHAALAEFLEWLEQRAAIELAPQDGTCPFTLCDDFKPSNLADRFLGIDRTQLDIERRAVLAEYNVACSQHAVSR